MKMTGNFKMEGFFEVDRTIKPFLAYALVTIVALGWICMGGGGGGGGYHLHSLVKLH